MDFVLFYIFTFLIFSFETRVSGSPEAPQEEYKSQELTTESESGVDLNSAYV